MKQGIHLGPPLGRRAFAFRVALSLLAVVTALNVFATWRTRRQVEELRRAVSGGGALEAPLGASSDAERERAAAIRRMRALAATGVLERHAPTVLLSLLQDSLPPGLTLTAVTLRPGPPARSVLVEAVAERDSDISAFQKTLAASPLVAGTALLEERRTGANQLVVRLEASLEAP